VERLWRMEQQAAARLREDPGDAAALMTRAQAHTLRNQPLQAAYILEDLLAADPEDVDVWVTLGFVKAKMNALEPFFAAWPMPGVPSGTLPAPIRLARTCVSAKEWDGALACLEHAAARGLERAPLLIAAELAIEAREWGRAEGYLVQASTKTPEDPAPWLRLCDLAIAAKDTARARDCLGEAEARNASRADIDKRRARLGQ
ncbi:MAG TPA: hypothetical protein HPP77_11865, partial [Candidatus Hydrogenedentes bacterium]|nr:hypothetical protein [Candidatus Hydrogenedentota bacterium]